MNPWMCRHNECGEIMSPRYAHVQQGRRACQKCSKIFLSEVFSLDADEAVIIMQSAGLEPLEPYPGNNQPWRCKHLECGLEVTPTRASIQQGQGGCQKCGQKRLAELFRTPDDVAIATMSSAGFEPIGPYPGQSHTPG
jgi:DNA-directed RNA polymerase subunit RPC12/RpoP